MSKQTYTIEQISSILKPIFSEYKIRKAILFGSYAKGNAKDRSDIDLLVDSGLKGIAFFGLLEDVVDALGKDVDLLDITQVIPNSEVDSEIAKTGVIIYGN
ncbi:nucleotidyltransferase domain-containing protein [Ruminococcus sp.]|uniref:nucleotidyltransferase family protein n=1 Tax=Ruminococcus sp. TaxID=41978 RepID=UPI0025CCBC8A|nr:nucleotidyltransferase domain-containing protein [Ruminococcus sp.]